MSLQQIHTALETGDIEKLQQLIAHGTSLENIKACEEFPIVLVSQLGYLEIAKTLLEIGADANERDEDGNTALMIAAGSGHIDIVRLLVEAGADVNLANSDGDSALLYAAEYGQQKVFDYLFPLTNAKDQKKSRKELSLGIQYRKKAEDKLLNSFMNAVCRGEISFVKTALTTVIDVNGYDQYGKTALYMAAYYDHLDIVKTLLKAGANPNLIDQESGWTPLIAGLRGSNATAIVRSLIEGGADIHHKYKDGQTSLMLAIQYAPPEVIEILIQAGADLDAKNDYGSTALIQAVQLGLDEQISYLLAAGASEEGLI